jgi:hypothetical protein
MTYPMTTFRAPPVARFRAADPARPGSDRSAVDRAVRALHSRVRAYRSGGLARRVKWRAFALLSLRERATTGARVAALIAGTRSVVTGIVKDGRSIGGVSSWLRRRGRAATAARGAAT